MAGEGTGGLYAEIVSSGQILFVDSEGAGGIIADSLTSLIELIVTHPYWRDLLKFSGGGSLLEMQRSLTWAAAEYAECYPEASDAVRLVQTSLGIDASSTALERLHRSVSTSQEHVRLYAPHGSEFESLFNHFTAPA
jgi:hypothetical protein